LASVRDGPGHRSRRNKTGLLEIRASIPTLLVPNSGRQTAAYIDPDGNSNVKNVGTRFAWLQEQVLFDKDFPSMAIIAKEVGFEAD